MNYKLLMNLGWCLRSSDLCLFWVEPLKCDTFANTFNIRFLNTFGLDACSHYGVTFNISSVFFSFSSKTSWSQTKDRSLPRSGERKRPNISVSGNWWWEDRCIARGLPPVSGWKRLQSCLCWVDSCKLQPHVAQEGRRSSLKKKKKINRSTKVKLPKWPKTSRNSFSFLFLFFKKISNGYTFAYFYSLFYLPHNSPLH